MMNLNILVTGANGQLGKEMRIIAKDTDYNFVFTDIISSEGVDTSILDITNLELNLTYTKPVLKVVFDQAGTLTYAYDLAVAIKTMVDDYAIERCEENYSKTGIYHFSNEGVCSWFDFTKVIAEMASSTKCNIQPCHSNEFPSPVKRPAYSVLDKIKIKEAYGIKIPYWAESLRTCINNLNSK